MKKWDFSAVSLAWISFCGYFHKSEIIFAECVCVVFFLLFSLTGCVVVCECCLNKFCVSLLFWAWNVYCAAAVGAYIKNQLTGITVFRCKSRRISSALWNACIWQLHWFCGRPQSPLTFSKLGKLLSFRWGCLNYNWLSDRSYRWQECFLTALSVFEQSRAVDTEARRINSVSFING